MVTIKPSKDTLIFSRRFNEALDLAGVPPKNKGRQKIVAKMFGVKGPAAYKWLNGKGMPKTERLADIAKELNVTADQLLSDQLLFSDDSDLERRRTSRKENIRHDVLLPILIVIEEEMPELNKKISVKQKCELLIAIYEYFLRTKQEPSKNNVISLVDMLTKHDRLAV